MNTKTKYISGILILFTLFFLQAKEKDQWLNIGFEYAHDYSSETYDSDKDSLHTEARGIALSFYQFKKDRNMGLFLHTSLLTPLKNDDFNYSSGYMSTAGSYIIGTGFRGSEYYNILQPYGGAGFHYLQFTYHDTFWNEAEPYEYFQLTQKLGVGGEIGCRVNFHPNIFLGFGTILAWDFYSASQISMDGENSYREPERYNSLLLAPFISLGYARINGE